jgi:deoxyribonuclease-4
MTQVLFGVAGNPPNFWNSKFKKDRINAPEWLRSIGLDALEVQCGYGVRMPDNKAEEMRIKSLEFGITLSVHASYYISIGSDTEDKIINTKNEFKKTIEFAKKINSKRIIFHPGSIYCNREKALLNAVKIMREIEKENELSDIMLYPEIAGKVNQLGSLEDILTICESVKNAMPCLDLAHLHARTYGTLKTNEDFEDLFSLIEDRLGGNALNQLHFHLYPVEWGSGGEIRHKAFNDFVPQNEQLSLFEVETQYDKYYFPRYESFLDVINNRLLNSVVICEAKDSQDVGALEMKQYYQKLQEGRDF